MELSIASVEEGYVPRTTEEEERAIRIVIGDAHGIVRYALRSMLVLEHGFELVGEAGNGREALDQAQTLRPDVMLLDQHMPYLDGLSVLKVLRQSNQKTKVILWTDSDDRKEFVRVMRLGCSGIVSKQTAPQMIVKSIRKV